MKKHTITQLISAGLITALILTGCATGNSKKTAQTSSPVQTTQMQTDDAGETKPATTVSKPDNSTDKTDTKTGDAAQQETKKEDAKEPEEAGTEEKEDGMIGEAAAYEKEESREEDDGSSESEDGAGETATTGTEQKTENSTGSDNTASVTPSNNSTSSGTGSTETGNTGGTTTATTPSATPSAGTTTPSTGTVTPTVTEETYTYETVLCPEMLTLVNDRRTSLGTNTLTWASDLESNAISCARGLVDNFAHPSGSATGGACDCIQYGGNMDTTAIHTNYVNSGAHDWTMHKDTNLTKMASATCYKKNSKGEVMAIYNIVIFGIEGATYSTDEHAGEVHPEDENGEWY